MSRPRDSFRNELTRDSERLVSALGLPLSRREAMRRCLFGAAGLLLPEPQLLAMRRMTALMSVG